MRGSCARRRNGSRRWWRSWSEGSRLRQLAQLSCCKKTIQTSDELGRILAREFVLPDAEDAPAAFAKRAIHETIARLVAGDFFAPEFSVLFGLGGVDWAAVPETTIDENGEAAFGENEIGLAGECAVSPPAGDARGAHDRDQTKLGVFVARAANARHDGGAFFAGEDVGHVRKESCYGQKIEACSRARYYQGFARFYQV